jgi:hypothetical protein
MFHVVIDDMERFSSGVQKYNLELLALLLPHTCAKLSFKYHIVRRLLAIMDLSRRNNALNINGASLTVFSYDVTQGGISLDPPLLGFVVN